MSIQINGTSGISGVDGTASTPALQGTDSNTGISFGTDEVNINTGGNTRAKVDSSGRLLVGTSTSSGFSSSRMIITGAGTDATGSGNLVLQIGQANGSVTSGEQIGTINFGDTSGYSYANIIAAADLNAGSDSPGRLVFSTTADGASSPSQRMRIIESGSIGFGNMDYLFPETDNAFSIGLSGYRWSAIWAANGTIQTSDEREKTNITDAQLGSEFIKSLRPVSYKWVKGGKVDTGERDEDNNYIYESIPGKRTHWGFIAQEVKQAVDNAGVDFGGWVLTDKDDPDSQQALRYDQFIAPLTKALQETMAELEALKAEVAALKGA